MVTVALQGDQGKLRPALIVQADLFSELGSVTVLPITSTLTDAPLLRLLIAPSEATGLERASQIMLDKPQTPSRARIGKVIGRLDDTAMLAVSRALAVFLGIA